MSHKWCVEFCSMAARSWTSSDGFRFPPPPVGDTVVSHTAGISQSTWWVNQRCDMIITCRPWCGSSLWCTWIPVSQVPLTNFQVWQGALKKGFIEDRKCTRGRDDSKKCGTGLLRRCCTVQQAASCVSLNASQRRITSGDLLGGRTATRFIHHKGS